MCNLQRCNIYLETDLTYILHILTFTLPIAKINQRDKDRSSDLMSDVHFLTLRYYGKLF